MYNNFLFFFFSGRERVLGVNHPSTLLAMYNLAAFLEEKGDLISAELFACRSLEGYAAAENMETDVNDGVKQLTNILRLQNKMKEANIIEKQYHMCHNNNSSNTEGSSLSSNEGEEEGEEEGEGDQEITVEQHDTNNSSIKAVSAE